MLDLVFGRVGLYAGAFVAIAGALWFVHHHIDKVGYERGKSETEARYAARDRAAEAAAQAKIKELEATRRAVEKEAETAINQIANQFEKERQNAKQTETILRARLATRDLVLRDPGAKPDAGCIGGMPAATASTGGSDGRAPGELSRTASDFLIGLASEADEVARQLAACQQVIRADRK